MRLTRTVTAITIILAATLLGGHSSYAVDTKTAEAATQTDTKKVEAEKKAEPKKVTVKAGDSLSSIADANGTSWVRIFNKNENLANPDMIDAGMELTIPTAEEELADRYSTFVASQPVAAAPVVAQTATTYTTRGYTAAPVNSSSYYVGNGMWCTDYVHSRRPDVAIYGNAGYNWIGSAQAAGKATGSTPQAGAVAVTNGHVAYVESVNADGSYVVSEMGWNYQAGNYNQRTVSPGTFGSFIY